MISKPNKEKTRFERIYRRLLNRRHSLFYFNHNFTLHFTQYDYRYTARSSIILLDSLIIEAVCIIYNRVYLFNCVHINWYSENITVLGSLQVFDESILLQFFYTLHSISVLGK